VFVRDAPLVKFGMSANGMVDFAMSALSSAFPNTGHCALAIWISEWAGVRLWSPAVIFGPAVRRFVDPNSRDLLKTRLQSLPYPDRNILGGRVLQSLDVVQAPVVQRVDDAGEAFFDIKEVGDETRVRVHWSIQMNL
jgi:hypothetical protein